jgi:thiamine biosynthesis lipoprotein
MRLDLGGIGIGYAVDEALKVLRSRSIIRALVDASGDIGAGDPPPGKTGWTVEVVPLSSDDTPSRTVSLANAAVSTAGDAFQFVEIGGRRYSHIVDPRTGLGLTDRIAVTVIAPDCTTADSLDTAVSVLGPIAGLALVEKTPGAAAFIVRANDSGEPETWESKRFKSYVVGQPTSQPDFSSGRTR